jgi:HEAT repeat protein
MSEMSEDDIQLNIERLKHSDPEVRYWAVLYLEYSCDPAAIPALIEVVGSDDNDMRGAAARALGKFGSSARDAIPTLAEACKDEDLWVRTTSEHALRMIQGVT